MSLSKQQYHKEEPRVSEDILPKNTFHRFYIVLVRKLGKMIELNLLYVAFWLPLILAYFVLSAINASLLLWLLVTALGMLLIGPATVAMLKILYCFTKGKPVFVFSDFMEAFKCNWIEATVVGELDFICFILANLGLPYYYHMMLEETIGIVLFACMVLFTLTVLSVNFYLLLMVATLDLSFIKKLKNSILVTVLGLKNNIIMLFLCALVVTPIIIFSPLSLISVLIIAPALIGLIVIFNSWPVIERYCVVKNE